MTRLNRIFFTFFFVVSTSSVIAQSGDPLVELKACARITDRDARFVCFDELGERALREEVAENTAPLEKMGESEAVVTVQPGAVTTADPEVEATTEPEAIARADPETIATANPEVEAMAELQATAEPEAIATAEIAGVKKAPSNGTPPLPENFGAPAFSDGEFSQRPAYGGTVTSCRKDPYGSWYFFLDNGQVWKQVKGRKHKIKECNFDVTIAQDVFGYKMRIDELEKTIRVRRQK